MATGDTAPPIALASSPPLPLLDRSPSNLSSPLSEVEDRDAEPDEMDLDMPARGSARVGAGEQAYADREEDLVSGANSDSDSKLSEVDINDSEAETERLYDTPRKTEARREGGNGLRALDGRERTFERSPSKLQQQMQTGADGGNETSDSDPLSDADDDASMASNEAEPSRPNKKTQGGLQADDRNDAMDSKKRKRSSPLEQSEAEQPRRKRTRSIERADDGAAPEDDGASLHAPNGEHGDDEGDSIQRGDGQSDKEETVSTKEAAAGSKRPRKLRRNGVKERNAWDETRGRGGSAAESGPDDGDTATADEDVVDADEEAETAHKNEEELERKRAAWEELAAIEKQFSSFRERLYQERLDRLDEEEAMLTGESPTHPEYLAMLQCLNERRDERIRASRLELQLRKDVMRRRAVAERAQVMSQYHQSVRASRERVLEELGKEWYDIQHERRRSANSIPDYGIRFPATRAQTVRHAVAYNKEVSILSGFAKYKGFPAAPSIKGASEEQIEGDFDSILRARQSVFQQASSQPYQSDLAAGIPFRKGLGPAGQQFLEQTPWANPNHPAHQAQRQQLSQQADPAVPAPSSSAAATNRRSSHQPSGLYSSAALVNGDLTPAMRKTQSSAGHENAKPPKMVPEPSFKRDTALQV